MLGSATRKRHVMTIATRGEKETLALTYEDYLGEGETPGRYEIIDGVREWMTNPTQRHQRILLKLIEILRRFELSEKSGFTLVSPTDILITESPLKIRQPDLSYMSRQRFADKDVNDPAPFDISPELVVEILSPNESSRTLNIKLTEYASVQALECWSVDPHFEIIEVWQLSSDMPQLKSRFATGDKIESLAFPTLSADVSDIFEY